MFRNQQLVSETLSVVDALVSAVDIVRCFTLSPASYKFTPLTIVKRTVFL